MQARLSDPALPAVRAAFNEARRAKAKLTLIHCIDPYWTMTSIGAMNGAPLALTADVYAAMQEQARERLHNILQKFQIEADVSVALCPAANALVSAAAERNAELLVVGTLGRTGLTRLVLGSVAESVATHARCSVLVVRIHRT